MQHKIQRSRSITRLLAILLAALSPGLAFGSGETVSVTGLGDLPPGVTVTILFEATVDSSLPAASNSVFTQATISGGNFSNVLSDDPAVGGASDPTTTAVPTADLKVTLTSSDATVPATPFTYTVTVDNLGPDDADNVVVTVTLDDELNYQSDTCGAGSAPADVVTINFGSIAATGQSTCTITVLADAPLLGTDVSSTADVTTSTDDPVGGNNSDTETTPVSTGEVQ
jgi:uncharacterized repeat protein (TIGR01451 family)